MSFGGLILTSRGRNLLAKAQAGVELKFTRVGLGDGTLGAGSITELQALRNEVKSLDITNLEVVESNAEVTTFLSNANMIEGFYLREIGLFALDPDLGEILYCYDNSGKDADYIPPEGEVIIERNMRFTLIVGTASSVTATINSSLVFVTKQEFEDLKDSVDGEIGNIEDLQTENKTLAGAINELERDKADKTYVDGAIENIEVPVTSVNGKDGDVTLTASDVGAAPTTRKVNNKVLSADITLTKADVELGNVPNYGVATTAQAQAGVANNVLMTPATAKAAIQHLATTGGISMVKSVQRGVANFGEGAVNVTIPISAINVQKSIVLISGDGSTWSSNGAASAFLENLTSTSVVINKGAAQYPIKSACLSWQVIEYM